MAYRTSQHALRSFGHVAEGEWVVVLGAAGGVGMAAVALGYTGYLKSLQYARERPQGRPVTAKDPATPQCPIVEHADVKRMLLAQKAYVEGGLALALYCARLIDLQHTAESESERDETTLLLDLLTPIAKSWPSQWCLAANDLAIQVHGGYGYTREYDVEQHYRDNRLNPIHEGTHGIQSLDLLGRKVTQRGGASMAELGKHLTSTVERAADHLEERQSPASHGWADPPGGWRRARPLRLARPRGRSQGLEDPALRRHLGFLEVQWDRETRRHLARRRPRSTTPRDLAALPHL